ncbi:MAG: MFS transporter, partial [Chloroflexota bacterium]
METTATKPRLTRKALIFIIVTAFLSSMGIGLLNPVAPYIVERYVGAADNTGLILGWLVSAYAICQFIAAPGLGILSDRF